MTETLVLNLPDSSFYFWVNFVFAVSTLVFALHLFIKNKGILYRPAFIISVFLLIFYQLPLVVFSGKVENYLASYWLYSAYINIGSLILLIWSKVCGVVEVKNIDDDALLDLNKIYIPVALSSLVAVVVYLQEIPFDCTAFYALIFDPRLTSLAREFSGKLISSNLSSMAFGAYANSFAPIFFLVSALISMQLIRRSSFFSSLVFILIGCVSLLGVLLTGTKGLLLPTAIMLMVGSYYFLLTFRARLIFFGFSALFFLSTLVLFELVKERASVVGTYDFATCSVKMGACHKSTELINSLAARNYSLGLPRFLVEPIKERLEAVCKASENVTPHEGLSNDQGTTPPLDSIAKVTNLDELQATKIEQESLLISSTSIEVQGAANGSAQLVFSRAVTFLQAIFHRTFVIPFQVSIWHFMYAETEIPDGKKTLPFAKRLFGESLNTPELVYQKYGAIYSGGDRTSTSTSPTSFFIAYPAYLGFFGFMLAIVCVFVFDLLISAMTRMADSLLIPFLVGLVVIISMNLMISDFVTVFVSHGGFFGLLLIAILCFLLKYKK